MDGIVNQALTKAIELLEKEEGRVTFFKFSKNGEAQYGVGIEFGKESEDSDMIGGAAYGIGESLEEAFKDVIKTMRWEMNGA